MRGGDIIIQPKVVLIPLVLQSVAKESILDTCLNNTHIHTHQRRYDMRHKMLNQRTLFVLHVMAKKVR